jgi:hypothetical protein
MTGTVSMIDHSAPRAALSAEVNLAAIENQLANLARIAEIAASRTLEPPVVNVEVPQLNVTIPAPENREIVVAPPLVNVTVPAPSVAIAGHDHRRVLWVGVGLGGVLVALQIADFVLRFG